MLTHIVQKGGSRDYIQFQLLYRQNRALRHNRDRAMGKKYALMLDGGEISREVIHSRPAERAAHSVTVLQFSAGPACRAERIKWQRFLFFSDGQRQLEISRPT